MEVTCRSCQRVFDLDEARLAKVNRAKCLCGKVLDLKSAGSHRLGKYVLEHKLAVGGMGEIWYAKVSGIEGFEREVAIKKVLPHLSADRDFINMLVKEAKLTVLLNHPNIVQVHDLAKEGDEYYIAMEYVPGINMGTLLEYCRSHDVLVPVPVAAHVAMQVLKGLSYAHGLRAADGTPMNLLHRDITPQNILVTRDGWVKITDFGIAKAKNEISTTSPGMIKGKLGYIAPEQIEGKQPDHRIDLFCAGIVLWEMLACRRLFKGQDEIDTFRLVQKAAIPALDDVRQDVPPALEAALRKGLAADPQARPADAQAFYEALHDAIAPWTVDDCANETKSFMGTHAELFARLHAPAGDVTDTPTVAVKMDEKSREITITDLVRRPAGREGKSRSGLKLLLAGGLVLGAGAAALHYTGMLQKLVGGGDGGVDLSQAEVQLAVDAERPRLLECYQRGRAEAGPKQAKLVIASTGGVARLELLAASSEDAWGKGRPCVEKTLTSLRFRSHSAPSFEAVVSLPDAPEPASVSKTPRDPSPKGPLTADEIQGTVEKKFPAVARCLKKLDAQTAPAQLNAKLLVQASGEVTAVDLSPPIEASVGKCLSSTLRSMRFRAGPKGFEVTVPLQIAKLAGG